MAVNKRNSTLWYNQSHEMYSTSVMMSHHLRHYSRQKEKLERLALPFFGGGGREENLATHPMHDNVFFRVIKGS